MPDLSFRLALAAEASHIATMINQAYRGDTSRLGWTTEADLLDGLRTSEEEVRQLIAAQHSVLIVCLQAKQLLGSVHMQRHTDSVHIGMFVVQPACQNQGVGKQLLAFAEDWALQHWQARRFEMGVISVRTELIAYYARRGYRSAGEYREFPVNPALWQPRRQDLKLELLVKLLPG